MQVYKFQAAHMQFQVVKFKFRLSSSVRSQVDFCPLTNFQKVGMVNEWIGGRATQRWIESDELIFESGLIRCRVCASQLESADPEGSSFGK
jgi:hypothetical protein